MSEHVQGVSSNADARDMVRFLHVSGNDNWLRNISQTICQCRGST
jgi:hypothetical protein